jgi:hypothetical protein
MRIPLFAASCASALILAVFLGPASGGGAPETDTKKFVIEALPDQLAARVESERKMLAEFGLADPDKTPKGVINALKVWAKFPAIKVCFFDSPKEVRARIAKIAAEWRTAIPGLPLDFGDLNDPRICKTSDVNHIRVGYAFAGYWSLVGTDSIRFAGQDEQSLNLEGFNTSPPPDDEYRATVLHEFGHAIGLNHEHQNPLSKCKDEFNWPEIYARLAQPPNEWSKEKVDFNMGALHEQGLIATKFDPQSIMLYTFPAWYYKTGEKATCYHAQNVNLSDGDKAIVAQLYPKDPKARAAMVDQIRAHHVAQIEASGQGAKSGVLQLIYEYLPKADEAPAKE